MSADETHRGATSRDTVRGFEVAIEKWAEADLRAWFHVTEKALEAESAGALVDCALRQRLTTLRRWTFVARRISPEEREMMCRWRDDAGLPLTPQCVVDLARRSPQARVVALDEMRKNGRNLRKLREDTTAAKRRDSDQFRTARVRPPDADGIDAIVPCAAGDVTSRRAPGGR